MRVGGRFRFYVLGCRWVLRGLGGIEVFLSVKLSGAGNLVLLGLGGELAPTLGALFNER